MEKKNPNVYQRALDIVNSRINPDMIDNADSELILASSTSGSTKKFKITVDDSGAITATEVT